MVEPVKKTGAIQILPFRLPLDFARGTLSNVEG
jgi:hypothetical protein